MTTFAATLLSKINEFPGSPDAALAGLLGKIHQQVNSEARHLQNGGSIVRIKGEDRLIRNYPHRPYTGG